jgi:hypothetical protein
MGTAPLAGYVPQIIARFEGQNKPLESAIIAAEKEVE